MYSFIVWLIVTLYKSLYQKEAELNKVFKTWTNAFSNRKDIRKYQIEIWFNLSNKYLSRLVLIYKYCLVPKYK